MNCTEVAWLTVRDVVADLYINLATGTIPARNRMGQISANTMTISRE